MWYIVASTIYALIIIFILALCKVAKDGDKKNMTIYRAEIESIRKERDEFRNALYHLVRIKELKDFDPEKYADSSLSKAEAWDKAKDLLSKHGQNS